MTEYHEHAFPRSWDTNEPLPCDCGMDPDDYIHDEEMYWWGLLRWVDEQRGIKDHY